MKAKHKRLTKEEINALIRMAWEDRCSFEFIKEKVGFAESDVIELMRAKLKPHSFKLWRKRVSGRMTKHRKRLKAYLQGESK
jgi:uncharacterized protein (TIGR03643 family)